MLGGLNRLGGITRETSPAQLLSDHSQLYLTSLLMGLVEHFRVPAKNCVSGALGVGGPHVRGLFLPRPPVFHMYSLHPCLPRSWFG